MGKSMRSVVFVRIISMGSGEKLVLVVVCVIVCNTFAKETSYFPGPQGRSY
jgi:hypothetical protein